MLILYIFLENAYQTILLRPLAVAGEREQSMSSMTMSERLVVWMRSARRSAFVATRVSSRSNTSYRRRFAIAAISDDLPDPGGLCKRYPRFHGRPVRR
jgi:hypothetical protein